MYAGMDGGKMRSLYPWQEECLRKWEENSYRGIVNVVTGAGKTVLALAAVDLLRKKFPDLKVKVVVPTLPLAAQWRGELYRYAEWVRERDEEDRGGENRAAKEALSFTEGSAKGYTERRAGGCAEEWRPGLFGGDKRDTPDHRVMIYIVNSARVSMARHMRADFALGRHVLLICDECHRYQSPVNQRIFSFLEGKEKPADILAGERDGGQKQAGNPVKSGSLLWSAERWIGQEERDGAEQTEVDFDEAVPDTVKDEMVGDLLPDLAMQPFGGLYCCLGLSATPFSTGNDTFLKWAMGGEIYHFGFDDAVQAGTISSFAVCSVATAFLAEEMEAYADLSDQIRRTLSVLMKEHPELAHVSSEQFIRMVSAMAKQAEMDPTDPAASFMLLTYQRKEISVLAKARIRCCLGLLRTLSPEDRILVFCERIQQAEELAREISRRTPYRCSVYHSKMPLPVRSQVLQAFREERIRILVSCRCLDEGIDVPDANIGIVMSSSAVARQRIQRLGRVIRRAEGKDAACLYYLYIRESSEDRAYLPGLERCEAFDLRYYPAEEDFSNDLYEYAGTELFEQALETGYSSRKLAELRRCLLEGLTRADYLLEEEIQERRRKEADTTHGRNYWMVMKKIGKRFRKQP